MRDVDTARAFEAEGGEDAVKCRKQIVGHEVAIVAHARLDLGGPRWRGGVRRAVGALGVV